MNHFLNVSNILKLLHSKVQWFTLRDCMLAFFFRWLCGRKSPCSEIAPVFPHSPEFYFKLEFSNRYFPYLKIIGNFPAWNDKGRIRSFDRSTFVVKLEVLTCLKTGRKNRKVLANIADNNCAVYFQTFSEG